MMFFFKFLIKYIFGAIVRIASNSKLGIKVLNCIYENSKSVKLINFLWGSIPRPSFDFVWIIRLLNDKKVKVPVKSLDKKSWEFALSYKWSDKSLTIAEKIIHDYYDKGYYFIDIGANLGLRTIYPLSLSRPVVLFEPNQTLKNFTEEVYSLNNYGGYLFENICLSDRNGEIDFYISPSSYMSSIYKENAEMDKEKGNVKVEKVRTVTLDTYLDLHTDIIPKILKIDTEGNEFSIIKGALKTIENYMPSIIVEILPHTKNGNELYNTLKSLNYTCFALSDVGNVPSFYQIKMESDLNFDIVNNFLFVNDAELIKKISNYSL